MGVPFSVVPTNIDETPHKNELPPLYVKRVAQEKAQSLTGPQPAYILTADTIVGVGRRILRKAQDITDAEHQIRLLSGRRHRVYTAVVLRSPDGQLSSRLAQTHVAFKHLEEKEIALFLASREWENVAVYRIDGVAGCFTKQITGLQSTVSGLPLYHTYQLLKGAGFAPHHASPSLSA
jgi:septum formation protein